MPPDEFTKCQVFKRFNFCKQLYLTQYVIYSLFINHCTRKIKSQTCLYLYINNLSIVNKPGLGGMGHNHRVHEFLRLTS